MKPITHLVAIVLGIAAPVSFTLWSTTDYGPRSAAHYARAAAADMRPVAVAGRFVDQALTGHDPQAAALAHFSPDITEHGLPAGGAQGAERLLQRGWADPAQRREVLNIIADEDLAVVQQLVFPASGEGPPHGEVDIFRVGSDGRITERWEVVQAPASPPAGGGGS